MQTSETPWWGKDCKGAERARRLCEEAARIANENQTREALIMESYRLYGSTNDRAIDLNGERCTFNALASATDTLVAEVTQTEVGPMVVAIGAGYRKQRNAERMSAHVEQRFEDFEAHRLKWLACRDAVLAGNGYLRAYDDGASPEPTIERLHPLSVLVDDAACVDVDPRELYVRRAPPRALIAARFPDRADDVERAAPPKATTWYSLGSRARDDRVQIYEAWHLPSSPGAGDGRHCICLDGSGKPLVDEDWDGTRYPIAVVRCLDSTMGWWGDMLAQRALGAQQELEKLMGRIQESMHVHAVQRTFVQRGSVITSQINNDVDGIVEYDGTQPPIFPPTPTMPADVFQHVERLKRYVFESFGIPELMASGTKPPGVNSAVGMRTLTRFASKRFIHFERSGERAMCHLAEDLIAAERSIAERCDGHSVAYRWAGRTHHEPWSDIDLAPQDMRVEVRAANALRKDAAGQIEDAQELVDKGLVSSEQALGMMTHPDIVKLRQETSAILDMARDSVSTMLDGGAYEAPDEPLVAALGLAGFKVAFQLMAVARLAGATTDELEPVRQWVGDYKRLRDEMAAREAALQPGQMPMPTGGMPSV
ncbi:MAG: hypothetical protein WC700_10435 [Gemmatimonadaceae bacterium]|jgi:hypothetical protein